MPIVDAFLGELEHEGVATRKLLGRIPTDKFDWKPHDKSMTAGLLASHIAEICAWGASTLDEDNYKMDPGYKIPLASSTEDLLAKWDANVAAFADKLKGYPDERMMAHWTMSVGDAPEPMLAMPRVAAVRGLIFSHLIHHRAQLGVYARLLGLDVPSSYGPSADEQGV